MPSVSPYSYTRFTMVLAELIGSFVIVLSIVYVYYKYVIFNFWHKRGVFYVKPVVPTGNATSIITGKVQIGVFFRDAYMKYKDHRVFGMYILFKPNLVIADPDLIRTVLTMQFKSFHDRGMYKNEKIDPLSGNLFLLCGKKWRNMRIKMTPTFTSKRMKEMFPILKETSEELAKYLESKAQIRDSVDMKDIFSRYSMDVIFSTAFGMKSNCIKDSNTEFQILAKKVSKVNPLLITLFMFVPQVMNFFSINLTNQYVINFCINMFRKNVEYRQAHNIVKHDFMNLLMQLMERGYLDPDDDKINNVSSSERKLTMTEAAAQSFAFFLAGFESSSTLVTFALYELALNEDIQNKVHKEIDEMLAKHGDLTYDAMNEMTYLHKVVNETLRKYPPLPVLNRMCTKEIDLPTTNIRVPEGTLLTIPVLGLHRDPSIYAEPDKFDPERFSAEEVKKRHPYAYLPFGEGPRNCIGSRFGYMNTKVGLVSLLSKFKFKLHSRTPVPLTFNEKSVNLVAKNDIYFIIEPIK